MKNQYDNYSLAAIAAHKQRQEAAREHWPVPKSAYDLEAIQTHQAFETVEAERDEARAHAERLAHALARVFSEYKRGICEIDAAICIEAREALAAWEGAQ